MASQHFWFKFFPSDWRKDPDLSRCSLAARGFWIDALCILQETEEPGIFRTNGIAWTDQEIAMVIGGGEIQLGLACLSELLAKKVCSRSKDGAIFSRRVVRDHQLKKTRSEAGKLGGNPHFQADKGNVDQAARRRAHRVLRNAVARGDFPHPTTKQCRECGAQAEAYHHFDGYEAGKELTVEPLCFPCHGRLHATERIARASGKSVPDKVPAKQNQSKPDKPLSDSNSNSIETASEVYVCTEAEEPQKEESMTTKGERQMVFDEHFQAFKGLCLIAGEQGCLIAGDEGSWRRAWFEWKALDPEQKIKAIAGIRARVEMCMWDDAVLRSLPSTVLAEKKYGRPIPRSINGNGTSKMAATMHAFEILPKL